MLSSNLITANSSITIKVTLDCTNTQRIDKYLAGRFTRYSRSFFAQLIAQQAIEVNQKPISKPSVPLRVADVITITVPAPVVPDERVKEFDGHAARLINKIEIIYEHEHFLILNKPAGIVVHKSASPSTAPTLVDWITARYADIEHVGCIDRPGIVHRLDKDTSGLIIIARTNYAHTVFTNLFKERAISKTYLALVHGHPAQSGTIDFAISRHQVHRKKMMAHTPAVHRPSHRQSSGTVRNALTNYEVIEYFNEHTLVAAKPVTGRTHQIRVHFSAIGHPLIGDALYGTSSSLIAYHTLHAHTLAFTFDNTPFTFTINPPPEFESVIKDLK
jgi:23S rRNA pseudouridine1911/1915/1917 synthase